LLEFPEERASLSIDMVMNVDDSGMGSLRATIAAAAAGDTIKFDTSPGHVTSPITLKSGELNIAKNLTIEGPGAGLLAVSGGGKSRVFEVDKGITASFSGLTITGGSAANGAGLKTSARRT